VHDKIARCASHHYQTEDVTPNHEHRTQNAKKDIKEQLNAAWRDEHRAPGNGPNDSPDRRNDHWWGGDSDKSEEMPAIESDRPVDEIAGSKRG